MPILSRILVPVDFATCSRPDVGTPVDVIIPITGEGKYGLMVRGTHSRTGLSPLFLGSVAERSVHRAPARSSPSATHPALAEP